MIVIKSTYSTYKMDPERGAYEGGDFGVHGGGRRRRRSASKGKAKKTKSKSKGRKGKKRS